MNYSGQIYPDDTVGYFRIASTAGRQPIHPVPVGEFLIGSGAQCQLRFGDETIEDVHATLNVQKDCVILTCHHSTPGLLVNGQLETECRLSDGDMMELGPHRMLFRFAAEANRITLDEDSFLETDNEPSLESLVDRIGEQIELVEELSHTPDEAVRALVEASRQAAAKADQQTAVASPELTEVRNLIQSHYEASRVRLESITEVLDNVVRQQKLIADTLEVLSARVQSSDSGNSFPPRRASA